MILTGRQSLRVLLRAYHTRDAVRQPSHFTIAMFRASGDGASAAAAGLMYFSSVRGCAALRRIRLAVLLLSLACSLLRRLV